MRTKVNIKIKIDIYYIRKKNIFSSNLIFFINNKEKPKFLKS